MRALEKTNSAPVTTKIANMRLGVFIDVASTKTNLVATSEVDSRLGVAKSTPQSRTVGSKLRKHVIGTSILNIALRQIT